jgi:PDZ domain-containing protein
VPVNPLDDASLLERPDEVELAPEPAPITPRAITLAVSTVLMALVVAGCALIPVPYAVTSPGPTRDTLGMEQGKPLIEVHGVPTYKSTGKLLLTTVSVAGGPGYPVGVGAAVEGWFDGARAVVPVEQMFAPTESRNQVDQRNQAAMISSQEDATVSALEELGYTVPTVLKVSDTMEGSGARDVLKAGDVLVALDGAAMTSFSELSAAMDKVTPGDAVTVGFERDGVRQDVPLTTTDDGQGRALLGVLIDPVFQLPVDVKIQIEDIGGPSAGTMFALGIIDTLTPEDEANGVTVAGTGTMDLTGEVGPIGGIRQKLVAASRAHATWFLAPESNCNEVVGHVPDGLHVARISTLHEAREALVAIGEGKGDSLPTCS